MSGRLNWEKQASRARLTREEPQMEQPRLDPAYKGRKAKKPGVCYRCRREYPAGTAILWHAATKAARHRLHAECLGKK